MPASPGGASQRTFPNRVSIAFSVNSDDGGDPARANAIPRRRGHCRSVLCLIRTEKVREPSDLPTGRNSNCWLRRRSMGQKPTLQIAARYVLSANA